MMMPMYLIIAVGLHSFVVKSDTQVSTKVAFRGPRQSKPVEGYSNWRNDDDDFPQPSVSLSNLVEKARLFARTYFSRAELTILRQRLEKARRLGADSPKIRQVVQKFVNEVLDHKRKAQIELKRDELNKEFGSLSDLI